MERIPDGMLCLHLILWVQTNGSAPSTGMQQQKRARRGHICLSKIPQVAVPWMVLHRIYANGYLELISKTLTVFQGGVLVSWTIDEQMEYFTYLDLDDLDVECNMCYLRAMYVARTCSKETIWSRNSPV